MGDKIELPVEDNLEMFDVVLDDDFYLLIEYPIYLVE